MATAKKAPPAPPKADEFRLDDTGNAWLSWARGRYECWLGIPLVGEYESFMVELERAISWFDEEDHQKASVAWSVVNPNLLLWQRILKELGGLDVPIGDLPPWMLPGAGLTRLFASWRVNPLARGEQDETTVAMENLVSSLISSAATNGATTTETPSESPSLPASSKESAASSPSSTAP